MATTIDVKLTIILNHTTGRFANREDLTEQLIGFIHDQLEHETLFGLGTNGNTEYEITDVISESAG